MSRPTTSGYQAEGQYLFRQDRLQPHGRRRLQRFRSDRASAFDGGGRTPSPISIWRSEGSRHASARLRLCQPQLPGSGDLDGRPQLRPLRAGGDRRREGQSQARRAVVGHRRSPPARRLFQIVKPPLADNRTLEPTQVAGFNQLFDDANGTKRCATASGSTDRLTDNLFVGAEATWRDLDVPRHRRRRRRARTFNHDEQTHRAYAYWTPIPEVALSAEVVYDRFEAEQSPLTIEDAVPGGGRDLQRPRRRALLPSERVVRGLQRDLRRPGRRPSAGRLVPDGRRRQLLPPGCRGRLPLPEPARHRQPCSSATSSTRTSSIRTTASASPRTGRPSGPTFRTARSSRESP